MESYGDKGGSFRYRIESKSVIDLTLMFEAFIAVAQAHKQEFDQGDHKEEEDLPKPPRFVFSIRAAIESQRPAYCRSIPEFY
jgi:hypothetical protein